MLPKTKYARSGDVHIAYQISGDGPVDVVWAPGTMSHLDLDWEIPRRALFLERFSKFCRLIRFDKRGTGLSDRPVKMATLEERADDIRAVMDDVGIERANIFGVSEGGSMACLFAATFPQRVNSLLVWGAQARWIASPDHPWGQTQEEHDFRFRIEAKVCYLPSTSDRYRDVSRDSYFLPVVASVPPANGNPSRHSENFREQACLYGFAASDAPEECTLHAGDSINSQLNLIPPPANHYYSAHEHCAEDERSTGNRPWAGAFAQREHDPDRIQDRLDQRN